MKIDLHCHSKYSKRPSLWVMQKLGCPESFTDPVELYHVARRQGMGAVTITDHNTIEGCLTIAQFPDTFLSCEYTTYFPEDGCKVHVIAYGITESQHVELCDVRRNVYDLVDYMNRSKIPHTCAHPLFCVNDRLEVTHIEKLILLFKNWELNGSVDPSMNQAVHEILRLLSSTGIQRLVDKHGILPPFCEPWSKNLTGGSDDHSSLQLARTYTEVPGALTLAEFWCGLENGQARVCSVPATPLGFARNIYGIAYQYLKNRFELDRHISKDTLLRFLDHTLQTRPDPPELLRSWFHMLLARRQTRREKKQGGYSLFEMVRVEAERLIQRNPQLNAVLQSGAHDYDSLTQVWFEFVNKVADKILIRLGEHMLERLTKACLFDMVQSLASSGALYSFLAPYFVSFSLFSEQREWSKRVVDEIGCARIGPVSEPPVRVAHFTDTFSETNGVAHTLRQQLSAAIAMGKDYTIITCLSESRLSQRGVHAFVPVGTVSMPEYPELHLHCPSFLAMLNYCYEEGFTHLHVSTPGPVGLAALGVARILRLPICGTYHTAFPEYAKILTEDGYMEELTWKYLLWFYDQLEAVFVPSRATQTELANRGLNSDKIVIYPRGVDTRRFHPMKKSNILRERFNVADDLTNLLYVGRLSREKNLELLCEAFQICNAKRTTARLILVGDGSCRADLERTLAGSPAVFTGRLDGEDLAAVYASADVLVLASTTDTFGNVVLEAQSSGIPVIVSDQGGPCENLLPGRTGLVVPANNVTALVKAIEELVHDPFRRRSMGAAARDYAETRRFHEAFERLWDLYTNGQERKKEREDSSEILSRLPRPYAMTSRCAP